MCPRHLAALYTREEESRLKAQAEIDFRELAIGSVVRLYWDEPNVRFFFAAVIDARTDYADAVYLETLTVPADVPAGRTGIAEHRHDLCEVGPPAQLRLSNNGHTKNLGLSLAELTYPVPGEKPTTRLKGTWGSWDGQPILDSTW